MSITGVQTSYSSAPAIGYAGLLEGNIDQDVITLKNVEVSASMPIGSGICWKTSSPASDIDALLPAAQADLVAGIVAHSNTYAPAWTDAAGVVHGDLASGGLVTGTIMNVLRTGKILVVAGTAVAPGDRLYVRRAGGTLGALENAADSTNMIDCTKQGQWLTTAALGGLAWLQVDFTNKP